MGDRAVTRFRSAVTEKLDWFGSALGALEVARPAAIADAFVAATRGGADIVVVGVTKAMDVLDPTFAALEQIGAQMIAHGVPAHPGSLLWLCASLGSGAVRVADF